MVQSWDPGFLFLRASLKLYTKTGTLDWYSITLSVGQFLAGLDALVSSRLVIWLRRDSAFVVWFLNFLFEGFPSTAPVLVHV